jgi:hypothetical protein
MTTFNEREKAFETKFALEQDRIFFARAYAAKVLGEWAAKRLGLIGEEAANYLQSVRNLNVSASNVSVVFEKVLKDLEERGLKVHIDELHHVWEQARADAMVARRDPG